MPSDTPTGERVKNISGTEVNVVNDCIRAFTHCGSVELCSLRRMPKSKNYSARKKTHAFCLHSTYCIMIFEKRILILQITNFPNASHFLYQLSNGDENSHCNICWSLHMTEVSDHQVKWTYIHSINVTKTKPLNAQKWKWRSYTIHISEHISTHFL